MDNNSVKENIARIRKASGISQTEMAERLGMSRTAYRNLEKGDTRLISETMEKIAAVLDRTPEELVLGYEPSAKDSRRVADIRNEYVSMQKDIEMKHQEEIAALKTQISLLTDHVASVKEAVRTKEEMISMLKRKSSKTD